MTKQNKWSLIYWLEVLELFLQVLDRHYHNNYEVKIWYCDSRNLDRKSSDAVNHFFWQPGEKLEFKEGNTAGIKRSTNPQTNEYTTTQTTMFS